MDDKNRVKSIAEAEKRLREGERFKYVGTDIFYDKSFLDINESPYRYGDSELNYVWNSFPSWNSLNVWKPCLCWVSDIDENKKTLAAIIVEKLDNRYYTSAGLNWIFATPVTPEELTDINEGVLYDK